MEVTGLQVLPLPGVAVGPPGTGVLVRVGVFVRVGVGPLDTGVLVRVGVGTLPPSLTVKLELPLLW